MVGGDRIGRDKITYIYEGPAYPRIAYRKEISGLLAFFTKIFVGRKSELDRLQDFAYQPTPDYLLVEGPPAFGKSAFAIQLLHRNDTAQWPGRSLALVSFFIRQDGRRHTPEAFCMAVNSQLLDLLDERGGVPPDLESQRSQLLSLWSKAIQRARADRPLLLLVDGLDEQAHGVVTIADLLPTELGPYAHVLVTSRPNPEPLAQVPVEHPLHQAQVLRLHRLQLGDIEELFRQHGVRTREVSRLAGRVFEVTAGEPLLVRFISQDVASGGDQVLVALEADPPSGVKDYFRKQFQQLDTRAEGDTAWEILGLLLVAHAAMTLDELAAVLDVPVRRVRKAITPIQRFLVGRDRVELMHLELRSMVADQFSHTERRANQRRLLAWCAGIEAQGWPDDTPDYVLENYASHLGEIGDNIALFQLINPRWMELKAARTHSHRSFAQDVLLAIEAARREVPPNFLQEVRGSLVYATLTSLASSMPPELLIVLTVLGQISRAEGYAAFISNPQSRSIAYSQIASVLVRREELDEAKRFADKALTAAHSIPNGAVKARTLGGVARTLAMVGHTDQASTVADQAVSIARTLPRDQDKAQALAELAEALAKIGHTDQATTVADQALTNARTISNTHDRARALMVVAQALARIGQTDQATTVADQAVSIARTLPRDQDKAQALAELAEALAKIGHTDQATTVADQALSIPRTSFDDPAEALSRTALALTLAGLARALAESGYPDQALTIAQAIPNDRAKTQALSHVAPALAEIGHADQALTIARSLTIDEERARALAEIAEALAEAGHTNQVTNVINQALATAMAIPNNRSRAEALSEVAWVLAATGHTGQATSVTEQALTIAQAIPYDWSKAQALADMASALAKADHIDQALTIAQTLYFDPSRARALMGVAGALAHAGHTDQATTVADQALAIVQAIPDDWSRAQALADVAPALAQAGRSNQALTIAQAMPDGHYRAQALKGVAEVLAAASRSKKAATAAQAIPSKDVKVLALVGMAEALAAAGDADQASTVANQALTVARTIPHYLHQDYAMANVARGLAAVGHIDQALAIPQNMPHNYDKARALAAVALALAKAGHPDRATAIADQALTIVHSLSDDWSRDYALADVALALAAAGHTDQALASTKAMSGDQRQIEAMVAVAGVLAGTDHTDQVATVLSEALTVVRVQGRSAFFAWLGRVVKIPPIARKELALLCNEILDVEAWWGHTHAPTIRQRSATG